AVAKPWGWPRATGQSGPAGRRAAPTHSPQGRLRRPRRRNERDVHPCEFLPMRRPLPLGVGVVLGHSSTARRRSFVGTHVRWVHNVVPLSEKSLEAAKTPCYPTLHTG